MAHGDDCKTEVVKNVDFGAPVKKATNTGSISKAAPPKKGQEKNYGAWGPTYKNKDHFVNMHFC